jgi:hypothetical protein
MRTEIKLFLVFLIFLYPSQTIAQIGYKDGFVITLGNDTIYGKIYNRGIMKIGDPCRFMNESGTTEYAPAQIKGFGFLNDKYYTSQVIENTFLQVLIQGDLSLYKDNLNLYIHKKENEVIKLESVEKIDTIAGKIVVLKDNTWIGLLTILVSDCIQDLQKIHNVRLTERNLSRIVIDYNNCKGTYYKDYLANKPWTKVELGFITGINQSALCINNTGSLYNYLDKNYQSVDPSFGLLFIISSPRFHKRIAFQSEIQIMKFDFYSEVINSNSSGASYNDIYIDLTTLSLPLSLKYTIIDRQYSLFLNAGINVVNNIKWSTQRDSEQLIDNVVYTSTGQAFQVNKRQTGPWYGIGFLTPLKKCNAGITLRYNRLNKLNVEDFDSNMNSISLSLIIIKK